jgi:hypothetical protein
MHCYWALRCREQVQTASAEGTEEAVEQRGARPSLAARGVLTLEYSACRRLPLQSPAQPGTRLSPLFYYKTLLVKVKAQRLQMVDVIRE